MDSVEDLKISLCARNFPELFLPLHWTNTYLTSVIMGDQIVLHGITNIFRLILRLVLQGLVHDCDNLWHVTTFVFSYSFPWTVVWYIFTWICSVIQIGVHVSKVSTDCNILTSN